MPTPMRMQVYAVRHAIPVRVIASDHRERGNPTQSVVASRRRSNLFSRDSFGSLTMTAEGDFLSNTPWGYGRITAHEHSQPPL